MPTPPETHFDATFLLKQTTRPKNVKVSQFYDSIEVKAAMDLLEEPIETKIGRGGYTWIHNDLRQLFDQWLSEVGKGRGKRIPFKELRHVKHLPDQRSSPVTRTNSNLPEPGRKPLTIFRFSRRDG